MTTKTKIRPVGQLCAAERHFHAVAVICLKDHPWGFTREDVVLLEELSELCLNDDVFGQVLTNMLEGTRSLQARILALLPPEK